MKAVFECLELITVDYQSKDQLKISIGRSIEFNVKAIFECFELITVDYQSKDQLKLKIWCAGVSFVTCIKS